MKKVLATLKYFIALSLLLFMVHSTANAHVVRSEMPPVGTVVHHTGGWNFGETEGMCGNLSLHGPYMNQAYIVTLETSYRITRARVASQSLSRSQAQYYIWFPNAAEYSELEAEVQNRGPETGTFLQPLDPDEVDDYQPFYEYQSLGSTSFPVAGTSAMNGGVFILRDMTGDRVPAARVWFIQRGGHTERVTQIAESNLINAGSDQYEAVLNAWEDYFTAHGAAVAVYSGNMSLPDAPNYDDGGEYEPELNDTGYGVEGKGDISLSSSGNNGSGMHPSIELVAYVLPYGETEAFIARVGDEEVWTHSWNGGPYNLVIDYDYVP